jgi:type IX secretion system PorP/SprF family membrane protein
VRYWFGILIFLVFCGDLLFAQRSLSPQTSQYMFSGQLINPAYSGSREVLSIAFTGRKQWIGVEGAPWDISAGANFPMFKNNFGVGFLARHDQSPDLSTTEGSADFNGRINLSGKGKISLGIRTTFGSYRNTFTGDLRDKLDPSFTEGMEPLNEFNVGVGIFYYTNKLYFGASVPRLLEVGRKLQVALGDTTTKTGFYNYNYLLTGGAYFKLSDKAHLKPSFLVSYQQASGVSYDINCSLVLGDDDDIWIGASYRSSNSIIAIIEFQVHQLKVGLSWDFPLGMRGINNWGSPEYFMRKDFDNKIYTGRPMFF